jgi:hypothetical protein
MKEVFTKTQDGTYYITRYFAFTPVYCQGTFVWFRFVYRTYLDAPGGPQYVTDFPYDPRRK